MTNFLPATYEKPASNSRYYKLQAGDNRFRILSPAIVGWIEWTEEADGSRRPIRTKERPNQSIDPKKPAKHFWSFIVYDYREKNIKIMEITQATIQDAIYALHISEAWGDPAGYDLNINKTGEKMETKYNVIPFPPKPLDHTIASEYLTANIKLEKLFDNGDPFESDATGIDVSQIV